MVHLIAFITAHPGKRAELLKAFHTLIPTVRAEAGCIGSRRSRHRGSQITTPLGPDTYAVIEKWASPDALRAHGAAPHMKEYGAKHQHLIAKRVLHVLTDG